MMTSILGWFFVYMKHEAVRIHCALRTVTISKLQWEQSYCIARKFAESQLVIPYLF